MVDRGPRISWRIRLVQPAELLEQKRNTQLTEVPRRRRVLGRDCNGLGAGQCRWADGPTGGWSVCLNFPAYSRPEAACGEAKQWRATQDP